MARLLLATVPLTGHVHPMLVLATALALRGHTVQWYAATKFRAAIEATGAQFLPMRASIDWDDADVDVALPSLRGLRGLRRVKAQLRAMFIAPMVDQLADLEAAADQFAPDAIVADAAHLGASALAEKRGLRWIGVGVSALMVPSVDTAPFGPGWRPARGWLGRLRNRFLNRFVLRWMFGATNRAYRRARVAAGLAPGSSTYFEVMSPHLFLQPTVAAFEYPRRDLPAQVAFIGPLTATATAPAALPSWWADVAAAVARQVPIVLVTQGTLATDPRELIGPTIAALADAEVLVIATTGRATAPAELGALPPNVRVAPYVPYLALLPSVAVFVTNGGYGGVQMALRHGVPMVVAGGSEEKPEIAARVAWTGSGIDLRTGRPQPRAIAAAVRRVLDEPRFRRRAGALAEDIARSDAPALGATLIEGVLATRPASSRTLAACPR